MNNTASQNPGSGLRMRARELTERVVELRSQKPAPSLREIAEELEVSVSTVHAALWRGIDSANERIAEKAGDLRDAANEELLQIVDELWPKLRSAKTIDAMVKVATELRKNNESRRRLHGLDKPIKIAPTDPDGGPLALEAAALRGLSPAELDLVEAAIEAVTRARAAAEEETGEEDAEP